jgi:hypothetical protein
LLLWTDRNHNGISEPDELLSLVQAGVIRIETAYTTRRRKDQHGNRYALEGTAVILESGGERERRVFDVFFAVIR